MTHQPFDAYGRYYDLFYHDKDYRAEVDYVHQLLTRFGVSGQEVLEFGSGTGRHGELLAEKGYQVLGIERSAEMVARASRVAGFSSQQGDVRTVQLNRTFDAVLSMFHVISYQIENTDVVATFRRAAEHLKAGGLFVFDVWYSPAVYAQRPEVRVKRRLHEAFEFIRIAEPTVRSWENRVDVNYSVIVHDAGSREYQAFSEVHSMRHFSLPELDLVAEICGFERVCAEGFLSGASPSEETWGICVVLRRSPS